LWLTIAEPKRGAMAEAFVPEPIGPTLRFLVTQPSFVIVLIGFCLTSYTNYATAAWIPPFLARVHHLTSAEIGTYAGAFKGLCGIAGTLVGGLVVGRSASMMTAGNCGRRRSCPASPARSSRCAC
jgi:predicted MFS family arabinose efflux permease